MVYLAMYGREIEIFVSLMFGLGIGFWQGHIFGKEVRFKRDAKGRFAR